MDSVDIDQYTGIKIDHCSIKRMTNTLITYTKTSIYLHASMFLEYYNVEMAQLCWIG